MNTAGNDAEPTHPASTSAAGTSAAGPDAAAVRSTSGDRHEAAAPSLSVVVPVYNEHDNIEPLLAEIVAALRGRERFEVVYVDDCSTDASAALLQRLAGEMPELRVLRHAVRSGQSAAIRNGVRAARGRWIATLDGDGQNDPADIPGLLALRDAGDPQLKLITGWRTNRRDSGAKRLGSRFANAVRRAMLRDETPDTGCGTKLFDRQVFLDLPAFDHMHRFIPALVQRAGWRTASVPVNHRPRTAGRSKYTNLQRLAVGIADLVGVAWLMRRPIAPAAQEHAAVTPTHRD